MENIASQFAFLGNFHPVAVHFPLALLPIAIALKIWAYWRVKPEVGDTAQLLLKLSLLFALLAALLGMTNAQSNGFAWNDIQTHASFAWLTILVLAIAIYLPAYRVPAAQAGPARRAAAATGRGTMWILGKLLWLVKWIFMIMLFPLVLAFLLLRKLYRISLADRLNPLFAAAWRGISTALAGLWRRIASLSTYQNWKNAGYAAALILVLVTGLHGADLVHGKGHLSRNAPAWAAALLGGDEETVDPTAFNTNYFEASVAPILRKNCMKCHGEDKSKGNLRLHDIDHIAASGVLRPKDPMDSEMIRRVLLGRDDPGAMPPKKNGRGLNSEEIAVLLAWINDEVSGEGGGSHGPVIPRHLAAISEKLPPLGDQTIAGLNRPGAAVVRVQEDHSMLSVNLQFVDETTLATLLTDLAPHRTHIIDLNIAGRRISPALFTAVKAMPNLVRLNLSRTDISDQQVLALTGLRQLRWLNLYGTPITELAQPAFKAIHNLETVHLGGTALAVEATTEESVPAATEQES